MPKPPAEVIDTLEGADEETLRATIRYCEQQLAQADSEPERESETKANSEPPEEFEGDDEQWAEAVSESEAPSRATLTQKTISGNVYLYWQWSEDGKTKSEYIAPKNPKR